MLFLTAVLKKTEVRVLHYIHNNPTELTQKTKTSNKNFTQIFSLHFLQDSNQLTGLREAERTETL